MGPAYDPIAGRRVSCCHRQRIRKKYADFKKVEQFRTIKDEADEAIKKLLWDLLPDSGAPRSIAAKTKAKIRQYFTTTLGHAQRTQKAILTRGRDFVRFLRNRVIELELPSKADSIVEKKAALGARLFPFKGGKATKWFIVIALGAASFGSPVAGGAALALAFTDP